VKREKGPHKEEIRNKVQHGWTRHKRKKNKILVANSRENRAHVYGGCLSKGDSERRKGRDYKGGGHEEREEIRREEG
jgi:hypothetical protein